MPLTFLPGGFDEVTERVFTLVVAECEPRLLENPSAKRSTSGISWRAKGLLRSGIPEEAGGLTLDEPFALLLETPLDGLISARMSTQVLARCLPPCLPRR